MTQRKCSATKRKNMVEVDPNDKYFLQVFLNRQKHCGITLLANYSKSFYKNYHHAIKNHMVKEMKKIEINHIVL